MQHRSNTMPQLAKMVYSNANKELSTKETSLQSATQEVLLHLIFDCSNNISEFGENISITAMIQGGFV